jgi:hypothetical protein
MAAEPGAAAAAGAVAGGEGREKSRGTLLALGIVLLWLAGVAFYFAFEGVLATEQADTTGGGLLKAFLGQVSDNVKASAAANKAAEGG